MSVVVARYDAVADTYGRGPVDIRSSPATAALIHLTGIVTGRRALVLGDAADDTVLRGEQF